ncbi:NAD(P)-binding protein [Aspergillus ellipticus CBS 707.79]|uniref:NAD(P)-binding protein n=1 Tax=Aspergillus ellipticus CBS 707.79 TaxID=1448320 RepID=A0A319D5H0_9EURO|nr:NAD(P)-binding protein [Aspergillus ellipticus CBS 707.79]
MPAIQQQTWFITGCSSGFGEQYLAHLRATGATILDLDITAPQAELNAKFRQAVDIYSGVDVLVNNAGYIQAGTVEESRQEEMQQCLDTNLHGPLNMTRAALPHLRSRGKGLLIYMSSQCGFYGEPALSSYCTSAIESLSKELAWLAPNIKPLLIEAGIFNTEVMNKINHVPHRVEFWRPLNDACRERSVGNYRNEPGNAEDLISKIIQIAKGVGIAKGREIPLWIPFGSDCLEVYREKINHLNTVVDDWEEVARSTNFPGHKGPMPRVPVQN